MGQSPDFIFLVIAALVGLVAHIALAISARYFNPLWTLAGAFFAMVPLSMATEMPGFTLFKYGRTYVILLSIVIAVFLYRNYRFRGVSLAWLGFITFYVLAAVWSDAPIAGIMFKGLTAICVIAGILTVYQVGSLEEMKKSLRVVLCFCAIFAGVIVLKVATNPVSLAQIGRLDIMGMNANRLASESAPMFLFCCLVALHDKSKFWKLLAVGIGTIFVFAVMLTGSRGSAAMGVLGAIVLAMPMVKRPGLLITLGGIVAVSLYLIVPSEATEAFEGRGFGREAQWGLAMESFYSNPFIGAGWVYGITSDRGLPSTANLHSIYFQILAETGILGMALFGVFILYAFFKGLTVLAAVRHDKELLPWAFVAAAFIGAPLVHGFGEASTITGGAIAAYMLAMGFAFLDRLPEMARERAANAQLQAEWDAYHQYSADEHAVYAV